MRVNSVERSTERVSVSVCVPPNGIEYSKFNFSILVCVHGCWCLRVACIQISLIRLLSQDRDTYVSLKVSGVVKVARLTRIYWKRIFYHWARILCVGSAFAFVNRIHKSPIILLLFSKFCILLSLWVVLIQFGIPFGITQLIEDQMEINLTLATVIEMWYHSLLWSPISCSFEQDHTKMYTQQP